MIEISVNEWTTGIRNTYYTQVDSTGNFLISVFVLNAQDVLFNYNGIWHTIFVKPNDTLKISIDTYYFPRGNNYHGSMASVYRDYDRFTELNRELINESELSLWEFKNKLAADEYIRWILLSSIDDAITFVPLETRQECLVANIRDVVFISELLLIKDNLDQVF